MAATRRRGVRDDLAETDRTPRASRRLEDDRDDHRRGGAHRGDYGTSVGHESGPSGQAAPILAGVAFFGTFFAAMAMRKRRERQRRRARGDVARQRPRSAARRRTRGDAIRPRRPTRVVSEPKLPLGLSQDIAFARTRGLVREDKQPRREEDYELLREYARRDEVAARENDREDLRGRPGRRFVPR